MLGFLLFLSASLLCNGGSWSVANEGREMTRLGVTLIELEDALLVWGGHSPCSSKLDFASLSAIEKPVEQGFHWETIEIGGPTQPVLSKSYYTSTWVPNVGIFFIGGSPASSLSWLLSFEGDTLDDLKRHGEWRKVDTPRPFDAGVMSIAVGDQLIVVDGSSVFSYSYASLKWEHLSSEGTPGLHYRGCLTRNLFDDDSFVLIGGFDPNPFPPVIEDHLWSYSVARRSWTRSSVSGVHRSLSSNAICAWFPTESRTLYGGGVQSPQWPENSVSALLQDAPESFHWLQVAPSSAGGPLGPLSAPASLGASADTLYALSQNTTAGCAVKMYQVAIF